MSCGSLCCREVDLAQTAESISVAARRMRQRDVGSLVIVSDEGKPVGVLTDRDIVVRVLAAERDPTETLVGEVMTRDPKTVQENTPIQWALSRMRSWSIRRVPVTDEDGVLVGILSLDDVLDLLSEEFALIGQLVATQINTQSDSLPWTHPLEDEDDDDDADAGAAAGRAARSTAPRPAEREDELEPDYFRHDVDVDEEDEDADVEFAAIPSSPGEPAAADDDREASAEPEIEDEPAHFRHDPVVPVPEVERPT